MNRREVLKGSTALAAVAMAGIRPASAQSPIVIKFSHVVASDAPKGKASEKFKELAEKYTAGKVKVEVYPNSSLYKDKEELEALQLGAVQLLAPSTAKFGPLGFTEFDALDLPFMFRDEASFKKFAASDLAKQMFAKLETKGVKGLAYWDNGFHVMAANKPIRNVKDFQGLKLRIQGSKVLDATTKAWGAIPQVMAFSEVYQALQTGVVDGLENVPSNFWTQKFYEVVKYIAVSHHGHLSYAVVANKKCWDGLPADVRPGLDKAMAEASDLLRLHRQAGERRRARGDQEAGQGAGLLPDARGAQVLGAGRAAGAQGDGEAHRQGNDRGPLQGGRFQAGRVRE